jgi:hypothetical protein
MIPKRPHRKGHPRRRRQVWPHVHLTRVPGQPGRPGMCSGANLGCLLRYVGGGWRRKSSVMTTIAILHPGEMGAAIGSAPIDVGHDDPYCSCQWTAARPANIRCWTRLIRYHAPRAGTDRSAVQVKHLDLGAQPHLPGPLLWVGLDTTVVTDVEDPSESLMLAIPGPSGVAVTGERRPRRLHLRRDSPALPVDDR